MPKTKTNQDMTRKEVKLSPVFTECRALPDSVNEEKRTVEVQYATETPVLRYDFYEGFFYWEVLSTEAGHVRLEKINDGAPLLDSHLRYSIKNVLGTVDEADESTAIIRFSTEEDSEKAFRKVKEGVIKKVSVGYRIYELIKDGEKDGIPIFRATDWEPFEISLVPIPADNQAVIRSDDNQEMNTCVVFEPKAATRGDIPTKRKEKNMPDLNPQEEQARADGNNSPEAQNNASKQRAANEEALERARQEAAQAERTRCAEINEIAQRHALGDEFAQSMINDAKSVDEVRQAALTELEKRSQEFTPRTNIKVGEDNGRKFRQEGVVNAILHRADPDSFKLEDVGRQYRGLSLMDLAREFVDDRNIRRPMEVAERAMSSSDMPLVLLDAMNKMVTSHFISSEERTHALWARRRTANDFKQLHSITVDGDFKLETVNENGEYKYTSLSDSKEKFAIGKYGKKIHLPIEMLINDDMSVFDELLPAFVAGAVDTELDIVYNVLKNNQKLSDGKSLFHADHNNLINDVFSIGGLDAMSDLMRDQKSLAKKRMALNMDFVLIGSKQVNLADRILSAPYVPTGVNDTNPYGPSGRKRTEIIHEPRITDISDTAWFAGSRNPRAKHISYAHLNGYENPEVKRIEGHDPDGITVVARHFFGAGAEGQYLFKSTGNGS